MLLNGLPTITNPNTQIAANLLEAILAERLICWGWVNEEGGLEGLVTTAIYVDPISGAHWLLIYSLYGEVSNADAFQWNTGLKTLRAFARGLDLYGVCAYVGDPNIVRLLQRYGAIVDSTFITFTLGGTL